MGKMWIVAGRSSALEEATLALGIDTQSTEATPREAPATFASAE
jgi:hypothetical protein